MTFLLHELILLGRVVNLKKSGIIIVLSILHTNADMITHTKKIHYTWVKLFRLCASKCPENILLCRPLPKLPTVGHSASNSGGMGTRGMSANFDDPENSMPSVGGNKLPPIVGEENEMREKSKKKKKKSRTSDDTDTDGSDHNTNKIENTYV